MRFSHRSRGSMLRRLLLFRTRKINVDEATISGLAAAEVDANLSRRFNVQRLLMQGLSIDAIPFYDETPGVALNFVDLR